MNPAVAAEGHGVLEAARRSGLLPPGGPVVVMASGGADSTCLLDVAVRLSGAGSVVALHVDHGLRDASADEQAVRASAAKLGVELVVERLDCDAPNGNLQAWAREQRYRLASELAGPRSATIAVGHTSSDQAETILYRLAAAPGRRALLGMNPRAGIVVRPLLAVDRAATAAYCDARGLPTADDPSNSSDRFARNRVRHGLVGALREIHPAAESNVVETARILRDEAEVLDGLVSGLLDGEGAQLTVPLARLREQSPALRRLAVQRMADEAVGRLAPGVARRSEEIVALSDTGVAMLDLPSGVRAIAERGVLRFAPQAAGGAASRLPGDE